MAQPLPPSRQAATEVLAAKRWRPAAVAPRSAERRRVLCLHGRLDNAASFDGLGPQLAAAGFDVVALDFPGHGRSPWRADGMYTLATNAAAVVHTLDALGWASCILIAHSLGTAAAAVAIGAVPERFTRAIFIEGLGGFGYTYAADFGKRLRQKPSEADGAEAADADESRVTAEPASMREAFRSAFVGIGKVGGKEAKVYDSVAAAVAARSVGIFSMSAAACEALVRRGGVEDEDGKFRFTHDTRSNVSYMLQVLTSAQGLHLLEYVPPSLVLCAGRSTGDTARGESVREFLAPLGSETKARLGVCVVEETGHHMHADEPQKVSALILGWLQTGRPPLPTLRLCAEGTAAAATAAAAGASRL